MPNSKKVLLKLISIITLWAFLLTAGMGEVFIEIAWAARIPTSSPEEFNFNALTIPQKLGTVKGRYQNTDRPLEKIVVHIQDAHCNYAAQHKIAEIIEYLNREYAIDTVNLEGGSGEYDISAFTDIQNKDIREKGADYFVKQGLVNGAEYYAINNPEKVTLWGVEDIDLYRKNLNIYRESLPNRQEIDGYLKALHHILSNLKRHIYSDELLELDIKYTQYKANNLELRDYISYLIEKAKERFIDIKSLTNVFLLNEALQEEGKIDFKKANIERDQLIDEFKRMLSKEGLEELLKKTMEFKEERGYGAEFYIYLTETAKSLGIDLNAFPELQKYIIYNSIYHAIDKSKVMNEIEDLEDSIKATLYQNEKQKKLAILSKNLTLVKNLFTATLIRSDYEYYQKNKRSFDIKNFTAFISKEAPLYGITAQLDDSVYRLDRYRRDMASFYGYSLRRDEEFLKNMRFKRLGEGKPEIAILVTGGFHADNICELFKGKGVSYISIMPSFKDEEGYECPYFSLLGGEYPHLEQVIREAVTSSMIQIASMWNRLGMEVSGEDGKNIAMIQLEIIKRLMGGQEAVLAVEGSNSIITFSMNDRGEVTYELGERTPGTDIAADVMITDLANMDYLDHEKIIDEQLRRAYEDAERRVSPVDRAIITAASRFFRLIRQDGVVIALLEGAIPINEVKGIELFKGHASWRGINISADMSDDEKIARVIHEIGAYYSQGHDLNSEMEEVYLLNKDIIESGRREALARKLDFAKFEGLKELRGLEPGPAPGRDYARVAVVEDTERAIIEGIGGEPIEFRDLPKDFVILAPIFNEGQGTETIIRMIRRLGYLDRVLFIDDASNDGVTRDILRRYQAKWGIRVSYRPVNRHKIGAIQDTLLDLQKFERLPERVIVCDGDSYMKPDGVKLPLEAELTDEAVNDRDAMAVNRDAFEGSMGKIMAHFDEKGYSAMGLFIVPRLSEKANFVERMQSVTWKVQNSINRAVTRLGGRGSVPGAGGVFNPEHLLAALELHSFNFELEDTETIGIMRNQGRKTGAFHRHLEILTDIPRDYEAYFKQGRRYQRGMQRALLDQIKRVFGRLIPRGREIKLSRVVRLTGFVVLGAVMTFWLMGGGLNQLGILLNFLQFDAGFMYKSYYVGLRFLLINFAKYLAAYWAINAVMNITHWNYRVKNAVGNVLGVPLMPLVYFNFFAVFGPGAFVETTWKKARSAWGKYFSGEEGALREAPIMQVIEQPLLAALNIADIGVLSEAEHEEINNVIKKAMDEMRLIRISLIEGVSVFIIEGVDEILKGQKGHAGVTRNAIYLTEDFLARTALHELYELKLWQMKALALAGMPTATRWGAFDLRQRQALNRILRDWLVNNFEEAKLLKEEYNRQAEEYAAGKVGDEGVLSAEYFQLAKVKRDREAQAERERELKARAGVVEVPERVELARAVGAPDYGEAAGVPGRMVTVEIVPEVEAPEIPEAVKEVAEAAAVEEDVVLVRQEATLGAFNSVNRKGDLVKVVVGVPAGEAIESRLAATCRNINRGLARGGFGVVEATPYHQKADKRQIITYTIDVKDPAATQTSYQAAMETAQELLDEQLEKAPSGTKGRIVLFAPQMEVGPRLADLAKIQYGEQDNITVVPDAYTDSAPEENRYPDIDVRAALARHISFYYYGGNRAAAINAINNLLSQVSQNEAITDIKQLLEIPLRIRAIDFEEIVQWQEAQEAVATSL